MSNVVSASDPLTSTEIDLVAGLNSLPVTPNGQAIAKTGTNTFYNVNTSGGGSGYQPPLTGSLNQTTFTWTTAPNAICVDGQTYQKTNQDSTSNWSGTTTTVLAFAPSSSIFAVA